MSSKMKRRKWHKDNKLSVFEYFKGICQGCDKQLSLTNKWDIHHHHYNYNGKLYETPALELIENKVITLLCRPCHDTLHTAIDSNNPQRLENKCPCNNCGKIERGIFDRQKSQNLDKPLCKECFQRWRRKNPDLLETCEICGQKELGLTVKKKSEHLDKLLCKLCLMQRRSEYLERFEECEICGKLEGGMTKRKNREKIEKILCNKCFQNSKYGIIQKTLF